MSEIKVDTLSTVSGSGNLAVSNNIVGAGTISGTNLTASGTLTSTGLITASAGVAIGGTGAVNTLDDYEEGTWTPTPATGTYTGDVHGFYTKVGRIVHAHCHIQGVSTISASTYFDIGGLPFACTNYAQTAGSLMTRYLNVTGSEEQGHYAFINNGETYLRLYVSTVDATYVRVKHNDYNNAAVGIRIQMTYITG